MDLSLDSHAVGVCAKRQLPVSRCGGASADVLPVMSGPLVPQSPEGVTLPPTTLRKQFVQIDSHAEKECSPHY